MTLATAAGFADPRIRNTLGWLPQDEARNAGHPKLADILIAAAARLQNCDSVPAKQVPASANSYRGCVSPWWGWYGARVEGWWPQVVLQICQ